MYVIYLKKNTTWDNYYVFWESIENDIEYGWKNISNILHYAAKLFSCVNNFFHNGNMVHIAALQLHTFETRMQRSISKIRNEYPKYVLRY